MSWRRESERHALASRGIKTASRGMVSKRDIKGRVKVEDIDKMMENNYRSDGYIVGEWFIRPGDDEFIDKWNFIKKLFDNDENSLNVNCYWTSARGHDMPAQGYILEVGYGLENVDWTPEDVHDILKDDPDATVVMPLISAKSWYGRGLLKNLKLNIQLTEDEVIR